ncbi:hypothetical protein FEM48_ZijujUnG0059600 [Ziziphus jujuba var. spinosa]|uniref:Large ribosomal subunit protein uL5m n=1 Tax=Ziziphus jujuba var. spinosa TaxID=714518 RepID=A0A978U907_ZIZJJ|nr:hypothetical protein FEM48_ZijujUnG0059600 [Ziziphus jujuba var. spinosa]
MEVPGSCEIRVVPKAPYDFIIKNGKLAMEIPRGQKFIQTQRGSTGKSFRSNPFLGSSKDKGYVSDLARQSTLRGHGMSNFSVRISTVMSLLDSPVEIRKNSIQFSMETEFCEFSPELEDHFEIFEHIRGFNVTIVTSANTQDETLPPWSGFLQKDEGETHDMRDKHRYKLSKLPRKSSFARVRNRCISTGRPRSVYEFFRISRIVFRGLASRGPLPAGSGPKRPNGVIPYLGSEMLTGRESKWETSLPPVSISRQVCSPDIDYVQGSTLGKIEYPRVNITLSYECHSRSKAENCCSLEHRSAEVVPIIEVRVWD